MALKFLIIGRTGQVACEIHKFAQEVDGLEFEFLGRDQLDLSSAESVSELEIPNEVDIVINAAAFTNVELAEDEEDLATQINGFSVGVLAEKCAAKGVPFVHISTDYVFDGSGTEPWKPDDKTNPLNAYGRSKLVGEKAVVAAGGRFAILRTSWVFSSTGNNFLKTMVRLAKSKTELSIIDDQVGPPTPAAAIASACVEIGKQLIVAPEKSGEYHFGGVPEVSWFGFAQNIFSQLGVDIKLTAIPSSAYPTKAQRPLNSRLDCSSLTQEFGIELPDWSNGVAKCLQQLESEKP